ncbi:MAG: glycyl-radical enzyme activating protein [Spirochaetota bacterium]|nr:glycyl-radical enzyme activating protein [Spirochaetota bacterium]
MSEQLLVTQIQRFSVNDGPGFRTNVFLKGCSLRCLWCHNPETQSTDKELYWKKRLCVQCGACLDACPKDAIYPPIPPEEAQMEGSTYYKIDWDKCDLCFKCVDVCVYDALEIVGTPMTIDEIIEEVEQDIPFYNNSGGGMTLSGGEPMIHADFVIDLLKGARKKGLHICLDTSGHCKWEYLETLLDEDLVDIFLFDIKHIDTNKHKELTGVGNELILENLKKLTERRAEIWIRVLGIPGYTDSLDYHRDVADCLKSLPGPIERIDLLPFHNWCQDKYGWLGIDWKMAEVEAMEPSELKFALEIYEAAGFKTTIGGSGFEDKVA